MIKLRMGELLQIAPILRKIMDKPMRGPEAFRVLCLINEFNGYFKTFNEAQTRVQEKYAKRDEDGNKIYNSRGGVEIDNRNEYMAEMESLIMTEINIINEKLPKVAFDDMEITPNDLMIIERIIE